MNEICSIEMSRKKDEQELRFRGRMCGFATCSFTVWVLRLGQSVQCVSVDQI